MSIHKKTRKSGVLAAVLAKPKLRCGALSVLLTVAVIAFVAALNVLAGALEKKYALTADMTALGVTDLSEESRDAIGSIREPVHIYMLYQTSTSGSSRVQVEELLNKYRARNENLIIGVIDPVAEPARVSAFTGDTTLSEGSLIVSGMDGTRVKLIERNDYYYYASGSSDGGTYAVFDLESQLTAAILNVSNAISPRAFFLSGHSELSAAMYCKELFGKLQKAGYECAELNLSDTDVALQPGDVLTVIDPRLDLFDSEYQTLKTWLESGGRLLFILSPEIDAGKLGNFTKLLDYYGLGFDEGMITEAEANTANWYDYRTYLVPLMQEGHPVTSGLLKEGVSLIVPEVRPIRAVTMTEVGTSYISLLTSTSDATVLSGSDTSAPGAKIVALTMLRRAEDSSADLRIALIGCYYTMADTYLIYRTYNLNFTAALYNWLANYESAVNVGMKTLLTTTLAIPDSQTQGNITLLTVVILPLFILLLGTGVWLIRRRM